MKGRSRTVAGLVAASAVLLLACPPGAEAGSRLKRPPDVDLDPDRGMTFGRLPKTSFDRRVFESTKQALGSQVMDPSIDPYNSVVRSSRYEPGTGKIRDSLTDKVREIRRREEASRPSRSTSSSDRGSRKRSLSRLD